MVQRLACLAFAECYRRFPLPLKSIAEKVVRGRDSRSVKDITKEAQSMLDAASRYTNLERVLGEGASLVLGQAIPESM
jgi:hypothetical protein